MNKFLHCLRIQVVPDHHEEQRLQSVLDFCLRYGVKNVMLFINSEEYNVGHMTKEEAKPWLATMKRAKKLLTENGISVSLNPWIEIGHLDRKRPLKDGQNFTTMVDYEGTQSQSVACPYCQNWRAYYKDFYSYIISEIDPEVVWVEDDFRLHNHPPLKYGGCFCALHMQKFNEKLGKNYTREQFVDKLFKKTCDEDVKRAWLDVNRECMRELAEFLGKTVKDLGLGTKVGLMSSMHQKHSMEGRDWQGVHNGLAQGGEMINRLHLPCYGEMSGKEYYVLFNYHTVIARALLPKECTIYPELENGSFSTFSKEARFLRFQLESSIPLCVKGMTYDIFDFAGNGAIDGFGYGQKIREITPYLNGVLALAPDFSTLDGVILPADEKNVYNRKNIKSFDDFYPDEFMFGAYLSAYGVNCKPSTEKNLENKVVVLSNAAVRNFTEEQLRALFARNCVIVDGGAAETLIDEGLGELICAKSYTRMHTERDVHSFEQAEDGVIVNDRKGYRATTFFRAGDFVNIEYEANAVTPLSKVYDYRMQAVGYGYTAGERFLVVPYIIKDEILLEQFHDLRTTIVRNWLKTTGAELLFTNHAGVYAYRYKRENDSIVIVVNSTEENFQTVDLELCNIPVQKISRVDKKSGKVKKTAFTRSEKGVKIKVPMKYLSTHTFIIS